MYVLVLRQFSCKRIKTKKVAKGDDVNNSVFGVESHICLIS